MLSSLASYDAADFAGVFGAILYVGTYFGLQIGYLSSERPAYSLFNMTAALCVLFSLVSNFNLASTLINASWCAISIVGLTRLYLIRYHTRFTAEEQDFIDKKLRELPANWARRVMNLAQWRRYDADTVLCTEGQPVKHLSYLFDGEADVIVQNAVVARIKAETLIGEMSCLTGGAASATVVLSTQARVMQIDAARLRGLCAKTQGLKQLLQLSFAEELKGKLIDANAQIQAHQSLGAPESPKERTSA